MKEFSLAMESALGDVRACESYINLHSFLYNTEYEPTLESAIGDWLKKAKNAIVEFFKKIIEAIKRFFAKLFGNKDRIINKHTLKLIQETLPEWDAKVNKIVYDVYDAVNKIIKSPTGTHAASELDITSIHSGIQDFKSECTAFESKVKNTLMGYHENSDYIVIGKEKLNMLNSFVTHSQGVVTKILDPLSKFNDIQMGMDRVQRVIGRINEIADAISYASSIAVSCINKSIWENRNIHETPKLEVEIPWDVMEFE